MRSVTLQLPSDVSEDEARLLLAIRLFQEDRVSLGKAAELAGYSCRAFAEILAHRGVDSVRYPASEVADDLANA